MITMKLTDNWIEFTARYVVEDIIRTMPEYVTVSGPQWRQIIGPEGLGLVDHTRLRMRRSDERAAFRQSLLEGFQVRLSKRKAIEGRLLKVFGEMTLEALTPWLAMLRLWLPALAPGPAPEAEPAAEAMGVRQRVDAYSKHATRALSELESWLRRNPAGIANRFPMRPAPPKGGSYLERRLAGGFRRRQFWARQARAVESHLDVQARLAAAEKAMIGAARTMLTSLEQEHQALLKELDSVVSWLRNRQQNQQSPFPPAQADIVAAAARVSAWKQGMEQILHRIPESIEVSFHVFTRPRLRPPWTTLAPRSAFQESFGKEGVAVTREGLGQLELQHQGIVREIERAREVVAFARETARADEGNELRIEREGISNALSLLEFHREHVQEAPPGVEESFVAALSATFLRTHTVLSEGQWGLLRQAALHGVPAAIRTLLRVARNRSREGLREAARLAGKAVRELVIRIGWISPPTTRVPHVIARGYLSRTLGGESRVEQLPMIYQRLFRLVPVEDIRFLIGRQEELAALAEAQQLWQQGHNAAALIVGERGSGKTSLINCALQSAIADAEVVRGEFSGRLTHHEEMYAFLAHLIGVDPGSLEKELQARRRVIVLEEMERAFLRRMQHYGAVRALINLISKASRQNLWIVSTNYFAFRFLNAAIRLDPHFSHRINAMAVEPEHMREAILMRHHLSGLRLQFAPRPEAEPYAERLRRMAGIESDPDAEFFDLLHREAGGVFRSAFALWRRYIERVEAGVLYLRYPAAPRFESVLRGLNDVDMYTLAAILQHGSLTPHEHSVIFRIDEAKSNAWMDNLLARELIEPDPGRVGLRVAPEAGEIVRQTLFQKNLG
ncbi:MAG: ATP-binding protein [Acidobacteria bacterium]|nr:ATP-binding protein [Acidobacteriota bacterium]